MKRPLKIILSFLASRNSLVLLILLTNHSFYGQVIDKILLVDYLKKVEVEQEIRFSYADETIEGVLISQPPNDLDLPSLIKELSQQTGLRFSIISERFISINEPLRTAEQLCGFLFDLRDKVPIEIATISTAQNYTLSDSTGYFELELKGDADTVYIQRQGYSDLIINANELKTDSCLTIYLKPDLIRLDEITVYQLLTRGLNRAPGGSIELNTAELGLLPGLTEPDVLQSIQALPGIQSINETISDINIRGGTNDQNLVLWDGIRMYQTGHFFGLISAFNPYLNNKVDIIKNGTSSFYGDGVSGTIDIQSDSRIVDKVEGGAGINMINADAFVKIPVSKNITLQIAGRRSITDLLETPMFKNYFERIFRNTDVTQYRSAGTDTTLNSNENFYFYDISGNLIVDLGQRDMLNLNFVHFFNDLRYQEDLNLSGTDDSKTSSLRQESLAGSLQYHRSWSARWVSNLQLSISSYLLNAVNFDIPNNQRVIQENEVLDLGLKLDTRWMLNKQWDFLFGYQLTETGVGNLEEVNNPEFFRSVKQVILTHALLSEANFNPAPGSAFRLGVRGNYLEKFSRLLVEPRLAVSQQLGKGFTLELLGELKHQTATQVIDLQNDFLGVESRRWIISNEQDVPIVRSRQLSTAIIYEKPAMLISLEGFYKYVTGITSSSQAFQNQFQFIRAPGDYEIYGSEFLVNWKNDELSVWSSYTFSMNNYLFSSFIPSEFPNNLDIRHALTGGFTLNIKDFEASAGVNWHSGKPFTMASGVDNGEIIYETPNAEILPDYFRLDLSARYNFKLGQKMSGQISGSVWNLTNKRNIFNIYYQLDSDGNIFKIEQQALAITPNLSLRVKF